RVLVHLAVQKLLCLLDGGFQVQLDQRILRARVGAKVADGLLQGDDHSPALGLRPGFFAASWAAATAFAPSSWASCASVSAAFSFTASALPESTKRCPRLLSIRTVVPARGSGFLNLMSMSFSLAK